MAFEVQVAVAKTHKYANRESGDTVEVVERPHGGFERPGGGHRRGRFRRGTAGGENEQGDREDRSAHGGLLRNP